MAMDGGASTSINYEDIEISSNDANQRRVKSFLVIENDEAEIQNDEQTEDTTFDSDIKTDTVNVEENENIKETKGEENE